MNAAEIARALLDADAEVRRRAVLSMPGVRDPGIGAQLLRALGDNDWRVRTEAIRVGTEVAEPLGLLPELMLAARQNEDVGLRGAALEVLVRGGDVALNTLVSALPALTANERQRALEVLARSGNKRAVQILDGSAFGADSAVIDALGGIGGAEAEAALRRRLQSGDSFVRVAALDALNRLDAVVPFAELQPLLDDRMTTRIALRAMGRCGNVQALAPLIGALAGPTALATTAAVALERCSRNLLLRAEINRRLTNADETLRVRLRQLVARPDEGAALAALRLLAATHDAGCLRAGLELASRGISTLRIAGSLFELGWDGVQALAAMAPDGTRTHARDLARELASELQARSLEAPPDGLLEALEAPGALPIFELEPGPERDEVRISLIPTPRLNVGDFQDLAALIRGSSGIHLGEEARQLVERKIGERVQALGLNSVAEYRRFLRSDSEGPAELERAIDLIAVHETYFFREPSQLSAFQMEVLPDLHALAGSRRSMNIWSAGCSTGEEVYTIAILIMRSGLFTDWNVRIIGNDISRRVIQNARKGVYRSASFRAMPTEYHRHFIESPDGREVEPALRGLCHFSRLNLLDGSRGAMVGRVDAIFCRNLLIYFDEAARRELISIFYDRLVPGGYLMLGHSESLLHLTTAFELVQLSTDLVYRKPLSASARTP